MACSLGDNLAQHEAGQLLSVYAPDLPWPDGESEAQVAYLLELAARYDLDQWVLFPTSDESAALLSKFHTALSRRFLVSTPPGRSCAGLTINVLPIN